MLLYVVIVLLIRSSHSQTYRRFGFSCFRIVPAHQQTLWGESKWRVTSGSVTEPRHQEKSHHLMIKATSHKWQRDRTELYSQDTKKSHTISRSKWRVSSGSVTEPSCILKSRSKRRVTSGSVTEPSCILQAPRKVTPSHDQSDESQLAAWQNRVVFSRHQEKSHHLTIRNSENVSARC